MKTVFLAVSSILAVTQAASIESSGSVNINHPGGQDYAYVIPIHSPSASVIHQQQQQIPTVRQSPIIGNLIGQQGQEHGQAGGQVEIQGKLQQHLVPLNVLHSQHQVLSRVQAQTKEQPQLTPAGTVSSGLSLGIGNLPTYNYLPAYNSYALTYPYGIHYPYNVIGAI